MSADRLRAGRRAIFPTPIEMIAHPLIRVLLLFVYAGFVAAMPPSALPWCVLPLVVVYVFLGRPALGRLAFALWRIRWLVLSIAILYFWFTPGLPLFSHAIPGVPTRDGLLLGFGRVFALMLMVGAVTALLAATSRPELIAAIRACARPLECLGLDSHRFSRRLVLTLEAAPKLQAQVRRVRDSRDSAFADTAARLLLDAEADARRQPPAPEPAPVTMPRWYEWAAPLFLGIAMWGLRHVLLG